MAFTITTLTKPSGDPLFYESGFKTLIETHLFIFKSSNTVIQRHISGKRVYQYEGDFYGLLAEENVPPEHYWIFLRVNGMFSPYDFGRVTHNPYKQNHDFMLLVPSDDVITQLATLYRSTRR